MKQKLSTAPVIVIAASIMFEAVYGIFQIIGICGSLHPHFRLTGHFLNPGPYGCFLALSFPIALRWFTTSKNDILKISGAVMVMLIAILIPFSQSRTAMVACVIGGAVALSDINACWHNPKKVKIISFLIPSLMLMTAGIYYVKRDSADGRILIWKTAAAALSEIPATGVGWDKVAGVYGESQEKYFALEKGSEREKLVADAPQYVFNEYLQVAIAYGLPNALLMVLVMAGGLVCAIKNKSYGPAGAGAAMAVIMFASYPMQFPMFVAVMSLVVIAEYLCSDSRLIQFIGCTMVTSLCILFFIKNDVYDVNGRFMEGKSLRLMNKYRESNEILTGLLPYTSDPMPLNLIGRNFQNLNLPDSAEYYYRKSANRCPNRLYPHYLLMLLYADSASYNPKGMMAEARKILATKEKISSPAVDEMKSTAMGIIDTCKSIGH